MFSARFFKKIPLFSSKLKGGQRLKKLLHFGKTALDQNPRLLSLLLVLPVIAWLLPLLPAKKQGEFSPEKVNLALRRTADRLLRAEGDSTSRIPAIEQTEERVWRVRIERPFQYDKLPDLLQSSLELHGIQQPYDVAIRNCEQGTIELGYQKLDFVQSSNVPCQGREMPVGCHYIEIKFLDKRANSALWTSIAGISLLLLGGLGGYWISRRKKTVEPISATQTIESTPGLKFGNSSLDVASQVLFCGGVRHTLTFRETKLLHLFAQNPDKLLERDFILQEVWADEGILVGRSVDVFVSRLRKKLATDPLVALVAVHGVGYRLETGKI